MRFEWFIAGRISFRSERTFSKVVVRIAVAAIALSVAVMISSLAIVQGFQSEIRNKVIGFGSHIQISHVKLNRSFETQPIEESQELYQILQQVPGVVQLQPYAFKPAIFQAQDAIEGVIMKGVDERYDWSFLEQRLVRGRVPRYSDTAASLEVVLSQIQANKLEVDIGARVETYFLQERPRRRPFEVVGIYNTGLEEVDERFFFGDLQHIRILNNWETDQVGGIEVLLNDHSLMQPVSNDIRFMVPPTMEARTIKEQYPQLFDWLELLNVNVEIILTLMILVASINMITALLIMILEKTQMIGILKALGSRNFGVRKIFIINAVLLTLLGLIIGNAVGLGLMLVQDTFHIIQLPQESYYVSTVPVLILWKDVLLVNVGTLLVCTLVMFIPSLLVTRITPLRALRFQ